MPDKNHMHHKLLRLGFDHKEAVVLIYGVHATLVTCAFMLRYYGDWVLFLAYWSFSAIVFAFFWVAGKAGWHRPRFHLLDTLLRGKLRVIREKNVLIRVSFRVLQFGFPFLLFSTCLMAKQFPYYVSIVAAAICVSLLLVWLLRRQFSAGFLRLGLYLSVPFIVYFGEQGMKALPASSQIETIHGLGFLFLVLCLLLTLKFTRRRQGFKTTPLDFLILFIVLVVPNLPDPGIASKHLGIVAAKIATLFFTFEVVIEELRGKVKPLVLTMIPVFVVLLVHSLII
jgi:UDP-GlcNAc:undecaprenyl-phosphate GlcNAc-1-phosphate transferase